MADSQLGVLRQRDLDTFTCDEPDCGHEDHSMVYMHPACHKRAGVHIRYVKATGLVQVCCAECGGGLPSIQVAP